MEKKDLCSLSDEELLVQKKKMTNAKLLHAGYIGFLAGVLLFGVVAWIMGPKKQVGFLILMLILVVFIYRLLKAPNKNQELEAVLKERNL
jgi:hypothetical protein